MKRTIIIGDIHGCHRELLALLDKLGVTVNDRIVSVGDLIVKGNRNREVLDLFIDDPRFSSVIGNHDRALLRHHLEGRRLSSEQERCWRELADDTERYIGFIADLKPYIELGTHGIVHAGVRPGVAFQEQSLEDLTTLRTLGGDRPSSRDGIPWYDVYDGATQIVFGHWAGAKPRRGKRALGLDTGCVYGGRLTAYIIETDKLVSVAARKTYSDFGRPLG